MKQTPLHSKHIELGARMGPFGGWDMPIQYEGILAEHDHTRNKASLFDTCHMGEFDMRGPTAEADLERLLTQRVASIKEGQCRYGFLLNDAGGVIDDLTCYRRSSDHFFLVVNAGTRETDSAWIRQHLSDDTSFTDLSPTRAKIDVQGPASRETVEAAVGHALPDLGYFRFTDTEVAGISCTLSRTGYTGEWGYEFYFDSEHAEKLWDICLDGTDIKPAGLGARDTLRLEMGYALYGHELSTERTPVGATRGLFIDTEKDFIGKEAVLRELDKGAHQYLAGLRLDTRRAARAGDKVFAGDRDVGNITSGSYAPSVGTAVAMGYIDASLAEEGQSLEIDVRGKRVAATVVSPPFYRNGTARSRKAKVTA